MPQPQKNSRLWCFQMIDGAVKPDASTASWSLFAGSGSAGTATRPAEEEQRRDELDAAAREGRERGAAVGGPRLRARAPPAAGGQANIVRISLDDSGSPHRSAAKRRAASDDEGSPRAKPHKAIVKAKKAAEHAHKPQQPARKEPEPQQPPASAARRRGGASDAATEETGASSAQVRALVQRLAAAEAEADAAQRAAKAAQQAMAAAQQAAAQEKEAARAAVQQAAAAREEALRFVQPPPAHAHYALAAQQPHAYLPPPPGHALPPGNFGYGGPVPHWPAAPPWHLPPPLPSATQMTLFQMAFTPGAAPGAAAVAADYAMRLGVPAVPPFPAPNPNQYPPAGHPPPPQ